MIYIDDTTFHSSSDLEICKSIGRRKIEVVIHDIDETHSKIREWPPVLSLSVDYAMHCGLREDFDDPATVDNTLLPKVGTKPLPETDSFCVETAGMATFVQMAYGILRALELGNVPERIAKNITKEDKEDLHVAAGKIRDREENYYLRSQALQEYVNAMTPRLYKLYMRLLNKNCRDKNVAKARLDPESMRMPGSMVFLKMLHENKVRIFFVTGNVIEPKGGTREEIEALGFEIGEGKLIEDAIGCSSWTASVPKEIVISRLIEKLKVPPERILVTGDGISEIKTGVKFGCVTLSRLDKKEERRREIHRKTGTNYIVADFTPLDLANLCTNAVL